MMKLISFLYPYHVKKILINDFHNNISIQFIITNLYRYENYFIEKFFILFIFILEEFSQIFFSIEI